MIQLQCPQCGKLAEAADRSAASGEKCPECGAPLAVARAGPADRRPRWPLWFVAALGLAVVILISAVVVGHRRDERVAGEAVELVEDYLRGLPESAAGRADLDLSNAKLVARHGTFTHLTGAGYSRPMPATQPHLEVRRTLHTTKGATAMTIYVTGTFTKTARVARLRVTDDACEIEVQHPDFR